jgi:predicted transcriptional regulator
MTQKTLQITVQSTAEFFEAALDDARRLDSDEEMDDAYVLSLPDEDALERVVSAKNLELVRTIATQEPESIRELARLVDRDIKNVSTAVTQLAELGLVEFEESGRAKKPTVWYDQVEIDIAVALGDPEDSDAAPA